MNLTPKQLQILKIIRDSRLVRGLSPTMQEIADELEVSKVTIFEHVETLIRKGALVREPNKARSLTIPDSVPLPDETSSIRFPLVGRIAAGVPIEKFPTNDELEDGDLADLQLVGGTASPGAARVRASAGSVSPAPNPFDLWHGTRFDPTSTRVGARGADPSSGDFNR